jgi:hypothetical protein
MGGIIHQNQYNHPLFITRGTRQRRERESAMQEVEKVRERERAQCKRQRK